MEFYNKLETSAKTKGSLLCVGLDPRATSPEEIMTQNRRVIEETAPYAACYKPNAAFYEQLESPIKERSDLDRVAFEPVDLDDRYVDFPEREYY